MVLISAEISLADEMVSGGSTIEAQTDVCLQAVDQLVDVFDGRQVLNRVC